MHVNGPKLEADRGLPSSQAEISWALVCALAAVQLVVTSGWMAYAQFQPKLLERFGLTELASPLALYLGLTGSILSPAVGWLGDRVARRGKARAPIMAAGGLLAGATFIAVALTTSVQLAGAFRWLLVGLIALWVVAMTVLQAPALSLLPATARPEWWPMATSPLVVATVLPIAVWPFVRDALDRRGGPLVFVGGGVAVVIATLALRHTANASLAAVPKPVHPGVARLFRVGLGAALVAFILGSISALVTQLAGVVVPGILATRLGAGEAARGVIAAIPLGTSAIVAPSVAPFTVASGKQVPLVASIATTIACGIAAPLCGSILTATIVAVLTGGALAIFLDCALPFAFELLPSNAFGLSSGLYLGGAFAGSRLLSALVARL
jgi:hypothetical protein